MIRCENAFLVAGFTLVFFDLSTAGADETSVANDADPAVSAP
jgi:hypothetical protein